MRNLKLYVLASLTVLVITPAGPAQGQVESLKEKAIEEFREQDYPSAIEYLRQALAQAPDDADVHYYLGYFTHYLCYDSVPLPGFGRHKSDEILLYFQRAVEIDPDHGNAFHFIGVEYGARANAEMQSGRLQGIVEQYRLGYEAGGYPDWLIEFGRNTLRSCDKNAILFTGGDTDTNAIRYLQYVERYRTDVTVIPAALLHRPWFIAKLKLGEERVGTAPISWSDTQIASMRPYKWQTITMRIQLPEGVKQAYGVAHETVEWELAADLGRGEDLELLSAGRAAFADIVATNRWERAVYFSMGCVPSLWDGLQDQLQLSGFVQRLLPFEPQSAVDVEATMELLLDEDNYRSLPTLLDRDLPRSSRVLQNYRAAFLRLVYHLLESGESETAGDVLAAMKASVPETILPVSESLAGSVAAAERILNKPATSDD